MGCQQSSEKDLAGVSMPGLPTRLPSTLSTDSISLAKMRKRPRMNSISLAKMRIDAGVETDEEDDYDESMHCKKHKGFLKAGRTNANKIQDLIEECPVVLFSKIWCPKCRRAKEAISQVAAKYAVVELEDLLVGDVAAYYHYLQEKTGLAGKKSLPCLFIQGRFISNHDRILKMEETGELAALCEQAGAEQPREMPCRARSGSRRNLTPGTPPPSIRKPPVFFPSEIHQCSL